MSDIDSTLSSRLSALRATFTSSPPTAAPTAAADGTEVPSTPSKQATEDKLQERLKGLRALKGVEIGVKGVGQADLDEVEKFLGLTPVPLASPPRFSPSAASTAFNFSSSPPASPQAMPAGAGGDDPTARNPIEVFFAQAPPASSRTEEEEEALIARLRDELAVEKAGVAAGAGSTGDALQDRLKKLGEGVGRPKTLIEEDKLGPPPALDLRKLVKGSGKKTKKGSDSDTDTESSEEEDTEDSDA